MLSKRGQWWPSVEVGKAQEGQFLEWEDLHAGGMVEESSAALG